MTQFSIEEIGGRDGTKALFSAQMALQWSRARGPKLAHRIGSMLHVYCCESPQWSELVFL